MYLLIEDGLFSDMQIDTFKADKILVQTILSLSKQNINYNWSNI